MSRGPAPRRYAVIPARGGSKRLPRKNLIRFHGQPIITYPIRTALACGDLFQRVLVSTEDAEIARVAGSAGAEVFDRPAELATDDASELDACLDLLDRLAAQGEPDPDAFCVIYPTAALITPEDLRRSAERLGPGIDVVMGVSGYPIHPYKAMTPDESGYLRPLFPEEAQWRTQHYPRTWASNGTLYWLDTAAFRRQRTYYASHLIGYEVPPERAVDIDTQEDLQRAERLYPATRGTDPSA